MIRQFSDAYFSLARDQKSENNQYLTFDETVTVNLDGKVYRSRAGYPITHPLTPRLTHPLSFRDRGWE